MFVKCHCTSNVVLLFISEKSTPTHSQQQVYTLLEPIHPKFSTCFTAQPNAIYANETFYGPIIIIVSFLTWPCFPRHEVYSTTYTISSSLSSPAPSSSSSAACSFSTTFAFWLERNPTMCRLLSNAINFHILENFCLPLDGSTLTPPTNPKRWVFRLTSEHQAVKINKFLIATHDYVIWRGISFTVRLANRPTPISLLTSTDVGGVSTIVGWFSNFVSITCYRTVMPNNMLAPNIVQCRRVIIIKPNLERALFCVHVRFHRMIWATMYCPPYVVNRSWCRDSKLYMLREMCASGKSIPTAFVVAVVVATATLVMDAWRWSGKIGKCVHELAA